MGVNDREREEREAKLHEKRLRTAKKPKTVYEEFRVAGKDRKAFLDRVLYGDDLVEAIVRIVDTYSLAIRIMPDTRNACVKVDAWDNTVKYEQRTIFIARHREVEKAVTMLHEGLRMHFTEEGDRVAKEGDQFDW